MGPGVRRDDDALVAPTTPPPPSTKEHTTMDYDIHDRTPETKAGIAAGDAHDVYDAMMRTFEEFKSENDERLKAIEQRRGDVVAEEKLARIDAAINVHQQRLDEISLKGARPALAADNAARGGAREHKSAFDAYIRNGESAGLRQLEQKAMSVGSNPDGGYLVPVELEHSIGQRLATISPIRGLASVREISGSIYKKPFMTAGPATGWVGETDARTQTASAVLDALSFPAMELYAMPAATATLLEDSAVNLDEWLAGEIDQVFSEQEGTAFVSGDGVNKPKGFLGYSNVANGSWTWGNLGYIASGVAGAFPASNPSDVLVDLIYALRSGYRQNAAFVMNRKTQSMVRKFKDSTGNYLWQPPAVLGTKSTLIGFPLADTEDMPDVAANSLSIAFGDFKRGYLIVDRAGVRVLRDQYSAKPYVLFYTTKRVGGGVQDFDAIKLLKFAVS
jgi:HK97 family phage major capsid protein